MQIANTAAEDKVEVANLGALRDVKIPDVHLDVIVRRDGNRRRIDEGDGGNGEQWGYHTDIGKRRAIYRVDRRGSFCAGAIVQMEPGGREPEAAFRAVTDPNARIALEPVLEILDDSCCRRVIRNDVMTGVCGHREAGVVVDDRTQNVPFAADDDAGATAAAAAATFGTIVVNDTMAIAACRRGEVNAG